MRRAEDGETEYRTPLHGGLGPDPAAVTLYDPLDRGNLPAQSRHNTWVAYTWWIIVNARVLRAAALSLLAATAVYVEVVVATTTNDELAGWFAYVVLALPAVLVGLPFVAFVMLPLFAWFRRMQASHRAPFILASLAIWLAVCAWVLAETNVDPSDFLDRAELLMLPGLVLVLVFGALA